MTVPSELLEGPVTKILGTLIHEYIERGCKDTDLEILNRETRAISMLVSSLGATHCSLALTNEFQSIIWEAGRNPVFKQHMDELWKQVRQRGASS